MENNNILYIPIQINGGTEVPNNLLERELFIKNGQLYVGTGSGKSEMVIGRVVDNAGINNPTIRNGIIHNSKIRQPVYPSYEDIENPENGVLYFIDEGNFSD